MGPEGQKMDRQCTFVEQLSGDPLVRLLGDDDILPTYDRHSDSCATTPEMHQTSPSLVSALCQKSSSLGPTHQNLIGSQYREPTYTVHACIVRRIPKGSVEGHVKSCEMLGNCLRGAKVQGSMVYKIIGMEEQGGTGLW